MLYTSGTSWRCSRSLECNTSRGYRAPLFLTVIKSIDELLSDIFKGLWGIPLISLRIFFSRTPQKLSKGLRSREHVALDGSLSDIAWQEQNKMIFKKFQMLFIISNYAGPNVYIFCKFSVGLHRSFQTPNIVSFG